MNTFVIFKSFSSVKVILYSRISEIKTPEAVKKEIQTVLAEYKKN